jgi:dynein heavy chain, axonemal
MMSEIKQTKLGDYYTLSKKGITHYVNGFPAEYSQLADWLVERSFYREISVKRFFKNFRTWKQLRMWRRNILHKSRQDAKQAITEKLFLVDVDFSGILLQHRFNCLDMMKLRVMDMTQRGMNPLTIEEFEERQVQVRTKCSEEVQKQSQACQKMF